MDKIKVQNVVINQKQIDLVCEIEINYDKEMSNNECSFQIINALNNKLKDIQGQAMDKAATNKIYDVKQGEKHE